MPIYVYQCNNCHERIEKLQKMSEPPLKTCLSCHQDALVKQVTAAGFQLKGSGWYVTDFRGDSARPSGGTKAPSDASGGADSKPASGNSDSSSSSGSGSAATGGD